MIARKIELKVENRRVYVRVGQAWVEIHDPIGKLEFEQLFDEYDDLVAAHIVGQRDEGGAKWLH